jgi:hypothetical protein
MQVEISGKVMKVGDVQEFGKGFSKRELVMEIEPGDHPQSIPIEFVKDKADLLDDIEAGDTVTVKTDLRGSYWEKGDRYFLSLSGWQLSKDKAAAKVEASGGKKKEATEDFPF